VPAIARRSFLAILTVVTLVACRTKPHVAPDQPRTTVTVVNTSVLDMTLFIVSHGQRVRLGVALSNKTTEFVVPAYVVYGSTPVTFVSQERVPNGPPFAYQTTICPGDHVQLEIH